MLEYKAKNPDVTLKLTTLSNKEVVIKPKRRLSAQDCVNIGREWQSLEENNNLAINTNRRIKREKNTIDELNKKVIDTKLLISNATDDKVEDLRQLLGTLTNKIDEIDKKELLKTKTGIEINAIELATIYDKPKEWFIENLDSVTITNIIADVVAIVTGVQKN